MKYIFTILNILFLPILSFKEIIPKLCINCKYFITDNRNDLYGKCSLFTKKEGRIDFLVNGIYNDQFHYCSIAREHNDMCGEEGKLYIKK